MSSSSSCGDDDMFPSHEPLSFDPSSLMKDHSNGPFASDSSALFPPLVAGPSPLPPTPLDPASQVAAQQSAIASLQQDVHALRQLLESEMSRMRQEMKQSLIALEARVLRACQSQEPTSTAAPLPPSTAASCAPSVEVAAVSSAVSTSSSSRPVARQSVWSGDFIDSDCGDDFAPSHPSQLDEKAQRAVLAHLMEQQNPSVDPVDSVPPSKAPLDPSLPKALDKPQPTRLLSGDETPKSWSAPSSTALSISSLTALINPAGLPLTEPQLIQLACRILSDHGSVPVGKMGSLLHKAANDHTLPALLKERYGGLKKFLQAQSRYFVLGEDHPYNPHVALVGHQQLPPQAQPAAQHSTASTVCSTTSASSFAGHGKDAAARLTGYEQRGGADSGSCLPSAHGVSAVTAGSAEDAYARSLVDSLMDDRDSFFSYPSAARTAPASASHPFFPSSTHSTPSNPSSYSSRLQESLSGLGGSDGSRSARERQLTAVVSLDCEMVGCGVDCSRSLLARCSLVNYHGCVLYDSFVQPTEVVSDYRTHVSGIRPADLESPKAIPFHQAQREVRELIQGRIVVAHSVVGDLQALGLTHPIHLLRDTAHFPLLCPDRPRSLRSLVQERLGWLHFQAGEHDSVEDARAAMGLYKAVEEAWEQLITDEQAVEEREKQRAAATSRHQQQREHFYAPSAVGYVGHRVCAGLHEEGHGRVGHRLGQAESGGHVNLLSTSHSSIHSSLWK